MSARLDDLLDRFQTGAANAKELAELEKLSRDASHRRRFVDAMLLDVQLHKAFAGIIPMMQPANLPSKRWPSRARWAVAAALVLAIGGLSTYLLWPAAGPSSQVETGRVLVAGSSRSEVAEGKLFQVAGDVPAVLRLADGSRAVLDPGTEGKVRGEPGTTRPVVELAAGGGTFQVKRGDGKFRVRTPAGSVTALGTEFTVKLRPDKMKSTAGAPHWVLAVSVAEGSVRVEAAGKEQILAAGEGRVFGDDGQKNNRDDGEQNNQDQGKNQ